MFIISAIVAVMTATRLDVFLGGGVGRPNLQVFPVSKIPTDVKARTDGSSRQEYGTEDGSEYGTDVGS